MRWAPKEERDGALRTEEGAFPHRQCKREIQVWWTASKKLSMKSLKLEGEPWAAPERGVCTCKCVSPASLIGGINNLVTHFRGEVSLTEPELTTPGRGEGWGNSASEGSGKKPAGFSIRPIVSSFSSSDIQMFCISILSFPHLLPVSGARHLHNVGPKE